MKKTLFKTLPIALALGLCMSAVQGVYADIAHASRLQNDSGVLQDYHRLVPLAGGSNFRDMGGYLTQDNHRVRRGLLFRSGVMTWLSDADQQYLAQLGVEQVVDLRSSEELEIYPNNWVRNAGIDYFNHDYSIMELLQNANTQVSSESMPALYGAMPVMLKPQLTQYFAYLVAGKAPIVVNCSAGQDRTGIASALLLSVLGVPREVVLEDYLLSSDFRRPVVERGDLDLAALASTNTFAALMSRYPADETHVPPLMTADGVPYLQFALQKIEQDYGSVNGYLASELGVSEADIATLKSLYLQ